MHTYGSLLSSNDFLFECLYITYAWFSGDYRKKKGIMRKKKIYPITFIAISWKKITIPGPINPPIPKNKLIIWIQKSCRSPIKSLKMQRLHRIFIIQQLAAATNMVSVWLTNSKLYELITREIPHMIMSHINIEWYWYLVLKTLINDPPAKYPIALDRKIKE
jgi:hypothetical protein